MITKVHRFFSLTFGLLFFLPSCGPNGDNLVRPSEIVSEVLQSSVAEMKETTISAKPTFGRDVLPILTERCAVRGCHVAGGPKNLDFSSHHSFIKGGDDGPILMPGTAKESKVIKEIVAGRMPPYGAVLTNAQIQFFIDWINSQVSFKHDISPILTERCALAGCHVAGGPLNLDFSTYQTFKKGGDNGAVFTPWNADGSLVIEEIVSGRMPLGGPPLNDFQTQLFIDWVNQGAINDGQADSDDTHERDEVNTDDQGTPVPDTMELKAEPTPTTLASFEQDLLPILRARCAFAGCHVAGGPKGIDLSTYQSFIRGGNDGPIFIPGNARSSDIIEEIVSGRMPIGGPQLSNAEIQRFIDWINSQEAIPDRPVDEPSETQTPESTDGTVSFQQDLLPILTARCAYSGCHDANGPDNLDFRTYQTFIRSAEDEDVFVPGNARSSDIIEEIVSGRMPLGGPPLTASQIQLFRDWINQQDPADFPNLRYDDDDDDHDDDYDDDDDDHDHDDHDDDYDDDDDDHDDWDDHNDDHDDDDDDDDRDDDDHD